MKYIIIPIVRFLYVLIAFLFAPFLFCVFAIGALWDWDKVYFKNFGLLFTENFECESRIVNIGEQFYIYRNPWDFLIKKKTYRTRVK